MNTITAFTNLIELSPQHLEEVLGLKVKTVYMYRHRVQKSEVSKEIMERLLHQYGATKTEERWIVDFPKRKYPVGHKPKWKKKKVTA